MLNSGSQGKAGVNVGLNTLSSAISVISGFRLPVPCRLLGMVISRQWQP